MSDRITLQLGVIGALHQCESVISLLNGASRSLGQTDRFSGFDAITADALSVIERLRRAVDDLNTENERQRVEAYEASCRVVPLARAANFNSQNHPERIA